MRLNCSIQVNVVAQSARSSHLGTLNQLINNSSPQIQNIVNVCVQCNIKMTKIEELNRNNGKSNPNLLLQPTDPKLHSFQTRISRHIPVVQKQKQKQKCLQNTTQQVVSINQPFYEQVRHKIQIQYDELNSYTDQLQQKLGQVNQTKIDWLDDKYRYYLRKFKKYSSQQQKLLTTYKKLESMIIQSLPVQQELKSISFIKMVSQQTSKRLQALKFNVLQAQGKKSQNHSRIHSLRIQLKGLKNQFFAKKRQQLGIKHQLEQRQKLQKLSEIKQTMQKIRFQKKQKLEEIKKSYCSNVTFSAQKCSNPFSKKALKVERKSSQTIFSNIDNTLSELRNINNLNSDFIKSFSQTCENFKSRKLEQKRNLNSKEVVRTNLQNFRIKALQQGRSRKNQQEQLLKNEQIIKQLNMTKSLKEQFREKTSQEVLNILIQSKKYKDLLDIIQEIKAQSEKSNFIQKSKINISRSQMYRNSSTLTMNTSEEEKPQNQSFR